jgi:hypothetical protein
MIGVNNGVRLQTLPMRPANIFYLLSQKMKCYLPVQKGITVCSEKKRYGLGR